MKRTLLIISINAILMLSGCIKENYDEPVTEKTYQREWYELIKTDTLNNTMMTKEITGYALPIGSTVIRNSFLYHSINGSDTLTLSGVVCWPLDADSCSEIWLESHFFSVCWNECPSYQSQPGMIICSTRNAISIGADYQGLGYTRDMFLPYLNTTLLASQNIDCFKAAMTLLKDCGPYLADDYRTYNIGYSLGGAVSMAIAKQIELDPELRQSIHLKKTFCGGGPYDQPAYFNYFLARPTLELAYPIAFLCSVKSISNSSLSFRQKYSYSDCYSENLLNSGILEALDSKNYNSAQINQMLRSNNCSTIKGILSEQMLDRNSQLNKDIFKEIEKLNLTVGWTPRTPILIRHSRTDTYVPFVCMESVIANLSDNPNVTCEIIESASHQDDGINFFMNLIYGRYSLE